VARWKLAELKASTRRHYADVLDLHVLPALGDYYLDATTTADLVAWRDAQVGRPATINSRLRALKTLFADVMHERQRHDPASRLRSVRAGRRTNKPKGLEPADLGRVLEQLRQDAPQWHPIALTLALTGARWGEVAALRWFDIDDERVIRIERAHVRGHGDSTKTDDIKEVPLVPELKAVLEVHRRALLQRQAPGLEAGGCSRLARAG